MAQIGIAASLSIPLDIPVFLRSLAYTLLNHNPGTPLEFTPEFRLILDAGTKKDDPAHVVPTYAGQWWSGDRPFRHQDQLNAGNLPMYLEHHAQFRFREPEALPASNSIPPPPPPLACDQCKHYCDALVDLRNQLHAHEAGFESRAELESRQAAGIYYLVHANNNDSSFVPPAPTPTPQDMHHSDADSGEADVEDVIANFYDSDGSEPRTVDSVADSCDTVSGEANPRDAAEAFLSDTGSGEANIHDAAAAFSEAMESISAATSSNSSDLASHSHSDSDSNVVSNSASEAGSDSDAGSDSASQSNSDAVSAHGPNVLPGVPCLCFTLDIY